MEYQRWAAWLLYIIMLMACFLVMMIKHLSKQFQQSLKVGQVSKRSPKLLSIIIAHILKSHQMENLSMEAIVDTKV